MTEDGKIFNIFIFLFNSIFLLLMHVFLGTCVDSLKKLPHVIKYETITPQKLHKLSQTNTEQQVGLHYTLLDFL
jgi:hypothetical protein